MYNITIRVLYCFRFRAFTTILVLRCFFFFYYSHDFSSSCKYVLQIFHIQPLLYCSTDRYRKLVLRRSHFLNFCFFFPPERRLSKKCEITSETLTETMPMIMLYIIVQYEYMILRENSCWYSEYSSFGVHCTGWTTEIGTKVDT